MLREVRDEEVETVDVSDPEVDERKDDAEAELDQTCPLAWDQQGYPIDVPEEAAGWRVRRLKPGDKGGAPEICYHNGRPLILRVDATLEELAQRVEARPGRYRLDAVDSSARPIKSISPAYTVVDQQQVKPVASERPGPSLMDTTLARALTSMEHTMKVLAESSDRANQRLAENTAKHTEHIAQVVAAMSGAVMPANKRQEVVPFQVPMAPSGDGSGRKDVDWNAVVQMLGPIIPMFIQRFGTPPTIVMNPDGTAAPGRVA